LVSVVPQDPLLFAASIRENLLYGRPGATEEEVERAVAAARARKFIEDLPHGYDTSVGERGVTLSTGQQQRISIARAFLKDAPLLLLDEPTSALDVATESDILDGLEELMAGRTVLIVTHRLSTIRPSHRVVVLAGGIIAEDGLHEELLKARGPYEMLWRHHAR
jgi:ATP-binding cassette, subfamily B, bacterial